jgi:hypothetical protein
MKVILKRGGNYKDRRFEASPAPQDVPAPFGEAMVARGPDFAEKVKTPRPTTATAAKPAPAVSTGSAD